MCKNYSVCGSLLNCYGCVGEWERTESIWDFGLSLVGDLWTERRYIEALVVLEDLEEEAEEREDVPEWFANEIEAWRDTIESER